MEIACATQNWWCKNGEWRAGYFHMLAPVVCPILGVPCWLEVYPYLSLYALLCNSLSLLDKRSNFDIWLYLYHTCADVHPILSHGCEFGSNHSALLWPIYLSSFSRLFSMGLFISIYEHWFWPIDTKLILWGKNGKICKI